MIRPILKDQNDLTPEDFAKFPIWIGVHNYDQGQPWYEQASESSYRPWEGSLPFEGRSQFPIALVSALFRLASGETYRGYFNPASKNWDKPLPPRRMKDGSYTPSKQWSARRGGTPYAILSLHRPVIFINRRPYEFHLKRNPELRRKHVLEFFAAIGKDPKDVFPLTFSADPVLFQGIVKGELQGFYSFPLDKPFEIDSGERYLASAADGD